MFLTRLYREVMSMFSDFDTERYEVVERVMRPIALSQTRRPRSDRGKPRKSISSSSRPRQSTSACSRQHDDNEDNEGTSRASTPSPTTYINNLSPLNYTRSTTPSQLTEEELFARQSELQNNQQRMHEEMRGGFKSIGKALKKAFGKKK